VTDADIVNFTAAAGAEIDRVFRTAMGAAGRLGGSGLRDRHGAGWGEQLIEFRTVLAAPDGTVTPAGFAEVTRYRNAASTEASGVRAVDRGAISHDAHGVIRATAAGYRFLDDLYATQAAALASHWAGLDSVVCRLTPLMGRLVARASEDPILRVGAFTTMTPNFEPADTPDSVLLLNRMSALRYDRSDAHAVAWRSIGLAADEMVAIQTAGGPQRDAIEARTNETAAQPFQILDFTQRIEFLADLRSMSVLA
jgi:hypothetical protein